MNYNQVIDLTRYCMNEFKLDNLRLSVKFSNHMTRSLGIATLKNGIGEIKLSSKLWERADETEQENTVIHECSHIIQFKLYPGLDGDHGKIWSTIHKVIGGVPNKYHCVSIAGLRKPIKLLEFKCACGDKIHRVKQTLASRRYNKYGAVGKCTICNSKVIPLPYSLSILQEANAKYENRQYRRGNY